MVKRKKPRKSTAQGFGIFRAAAHHGQKAVGRRAGLLHRDFSSHADGVDNEPFFKGWAKPGPIPPGATAGSPGVAEGETLDAISGHYRLLQLKNGHRFSTDDVLTAWYGTS